MGEVLSPCVTVEIVPSLFEGDFSSGDHSLLRHHKESGKFVFSFLTFDLSFKVSCSPCWSKGANMELCGMNKSRSHIHYEL